MCFIYKCVNLVYVSVIIYAKVSFYKIYLEKRDIHTIYYVCFAAIFCSLRFTTSTLNLLYTTFNPENTTQPLTLKISLYTIFNHENIPRGSGDWIQSQWC